MHRAGLLSLLLAGLAGTASAVPPDDQDVSIAFELLAAGRPVACAQPLPPMGRDRYSSELRDARFYVQDVALIDAAGRKVALRLDRNDWQDGSVALLDFEDARGRCSGGTAASNRQVTGKAPAGRYRGVAFTVGVPTALNHTSTELADPPLDIAAMGWSWQAGRKYAKLEIDPRDGVNKPDGSHAPTWYLHLGATGCIGNPMTGETIACSHSNRLPVTLTRFDPQRQAVALDLASLLSESELGADRGGAVGCMSATTDPECAAVFARLGLSLATGMPLSPGRSAVFSAIAKP